MAPSGAGMYAVGCLLSLLLAALGWVRAEPNVTTPVDPQCVSIDDPIEAALSFGTQLPNVTLEPGCHIIMRNFACTPINSSFAIIGSATGVSTWDMDFALYKFSVEPGVVLTLRNLVLSRALVFTSANADLEPKGDVPALQLAIFHMRPDSRLELQNVTVQTQCTTLTYYLTKLPGIQPPAPTVLTFEDTTIGAVKLRNVTVCCNQGQELSSPVDLYVHSVPMLKSFLAAASALSIRATFNLMDNLTLPYISPPSYITETGDQRDGLVTADTVISGSNASALTYVDSNFTASWLTVQWPARLTLRHLVLTRLYETIVPGGSKGLLAGGLPLAMVKVTGSATQPIRYFEDVTVVVSQYEVTEMTYWCVMFSVGTPEVKFVADFLRSYVWPNNFDVLDSTQLYLERVRTVSSMFVRVRLTSQPPPGVPFVNSGPPAAVATYQHVQPPLFIVGTGMDWANAVAPVLPQDTWPRSSLSGNTISNGSGNDSLPALVLINGTVTLQPSDVQVSRGGGMRVVRRSVVVTSMRQGCSSSDPSCPPAILDMSGITDAMQLEGLNTTVVFMGITLRNFTSTVNLQTINAAAADPNSLGGFFRFDRSSVHISFESVTVEVKADAFAGLHRLISFLPRGGNAGDVHVISMSGNLIQLESFQFVGARGSYVNFTLVDGAADLSALQDSGANSGDGDGKASRSVVPITVGAVVGSCGLLLLVGGVVWYAQGHRLRSLRQKAGGVQAGLAGDKRYGSGDGDVSLEGSGASTSRAFGGEPCPGGGDDIGFGDALCPRSGDNSGSTVAAAAVMAMAAAATTELTHTCDQVKISDEESPQCTTFTVSDLNSSETAMVLQALPQMVAAQPPLTLSVSSVSGHMPRRAFSVARSVPEEDELGASIGSSIREDGASRGSGCSTSTGGVRGRLLLDAAAGDSVTAAAASAAVAVNYRKALPSLLDPPADVSGRGSGASSTMRRMMRMASGGRTHMYGAGELGRSSGLRVRAVLGRSPSRPARSTASSSGGPLMAPQPAILALPVSPIVTEATPSTTPARFRGDRVNHQQTPCLRHGGAGSQRREASFPMLVRSGGGATAINGTSGSVDLVGGEATASHSVQLMATGGTLDQMSGPNLDPDIVSPAVSNSLSKVPEPASEVQRLIQELSTNGTDQLVILEPIGQGGYGMVYRGVWRNLDVAVKTVLFQDRANLASPQLSCLANTSAPSNAQAIQMSVIDDDVDGSQKERSSRPGSATFTTHTTQAIVATSGAAIHLCGALAAGAPGSGSSRDVQASCTGAGGTHNWALASQQAANSSSLPSVNVGGAGPLAVASQQRAVLEAAVSCSVAHPNVVATYHYDITPIRPSGAVCSGGLLISDGSHMRPGCGTGPGVFPVGPGAVSDWKLYLVQEFCDGGSLANALDARAFHDPAGMPNLALTLCALADIARGMAHIHSRSIIHGDLNPTNILLRSVSGSNGGIMPMWNRVALTGGIAGGGGSGSTTPGGSISAAAQLRHELGVTLVAKVADFGLCGMLAPGKRHISNAIRGTPFYTAPETVATGTLTKASDVYSFGVIAWEVYTGRPPFQHVPQKGFVRDESFPRLPPHVPATFANMAQACVSTEPDARPTFDQILDRLMSLQSKLAVSLHQRLSRLMAGSGAFLGATSPLGPGTTASTPHGAATPTSGLGNGAAWLGPSLPYCCTGNGTGCGGGGSGGFSYGSSQSASMPPQPVCNTGVAMCMGVTTASTGPGGTSSSGLLASCGGVPNFPLSMPPQPVCTTGMAMGMGVTTASTGPGGTSSTGLLASCGGVPNFPLSMPCVLPASAPQQVASVASSQ